MQIKLHANATTTPKIRTYIQNSTASVAELAKELSVSQTTIRRWRARKSTSDRSHKKNNLGQSTSPVKETLITSLRRDVGLSIDDIVDVMHRCVNKKLSRRAIYRCLKRYNLSSRDKLESKKQKQKFEVTDFGFVHVDLMHLPSLKRKKAYVFVSIEQSNQVRLY